MSEHECILPGDTKRMARRDCLACMRSDSSRMRELLIQIRPILIDACTQQYPGVRGILYDLTETLERTKND